MDNTLKTATLRQRSKHDEHAVDKNENASIQATQADENKNAARPSKTPHVDEKAEVVARSSTFLFAITDPGNFGVINGVLNDPDCAPWLFLFLAVLFGYASLLTLGNRTATWIAAVISLALCFVRLSNDTYVTFIFGCYAGRAFIRTLGIAMATDHTFKNRSPYYTYKYMLSIDDLLQNRLLSKHLHRSTIMSQLRQLHFNVFAFVISVLSLMFLNVGGLSKGQALTRMATWPIPFSSDQLVDIYELSSTLTNEHYTFITLVKYPLGFIRFFNGTMFVSNCYHIHTVMVTGCEPSPGFINVFESKKLSELWGKRWNIPMRNNLQRAVYSPLKRAGFPTAGKVCTFLASAMFHMYPFYLVGVSSRNVVFMGMFFIVQLPLIALESHFNLEGKMWFWCSTWSVSWLFLEPMADLFGDY